MSVQQIIDWDNVKRYVRQGWVKHLVIPKTSYELNGKIESCVPMRMKALLTVLESHSRDKHSCFLKRETIARSIGCGVRTVVRAIEDCEAMELLTVDRIYWARKDSKYVVNWTRVAQLLLSNPETAKHVPVSEVAVETERPDEFTRANLSRVPEFSPVPICHSPVPICHSTRANLSRSDDDRTSYTRVRGESNHQSSKETIFKTSAEEDDSDEEFENENEDEEKEGSECEKPRGPKWPITINPNSLRMGFAVELLWQYAIKLDWGLVPEDRARFFALAHNLARIEPKRKNAGKPIRNLAGLFTFLVKRRRWQSTQVGEDWARNEISNEDRRQRAKTESKFEILERVRR